MIMSLSNFDNHSKTLTFKKCKCLLHKYYPTRFSKICKISAHLNQFLAKLMITCKIETFYDKLLKNANVSKLGNGKNLTTALYSESTKPGNFFNETNTIIK